MKMNEMKRMKKGQGGFTLIELMIVIAIIGILAAVALPRYLDYTNRAKASEVVMAASAAKTCVSEINQSDQAATAYDTCGSTANDTQYVSGVAVASGAVTMAGAGGVITATGQDDMTGLEVVLKPIVDNDTDMNVTGWECGYGSLTGDANQNWLPGSCRADHSGL